MRRANLEYLRHLVLRLHKAIVDVEREAFERSHGRVAAHQFLDVLLKDPAFAWLRPMSMLIVRMDEWLDEDEPPADEANACADELRRLLTPDPAGDDFQRRYLDLLHGHPDVTLAHAAVMRAL